MRIQELTALELGKKIKNKEISSPEATKIWLDAAKEDFNKKDDESKINGYISIDEESAIAAAEAVQQKIDAGENTSSLAGVPVAIKDNICIKNGNTTAASRMLENFKPPYNATVIEKLRDAGAVFLGKTNMDEFAMGGSTETSFYGITRNPWNLNKVPGGSSGGSAAVVAGGLAPYSLGSDTGGSIRQPCAFTGTTGIKPTYGSVSRFGLMAYASSLDQIGPIASDAKSCAAALSIISGSDDKDSTSIADEPFDFSAIVNAENVEQGLKGKKIGIPSNYYKEGLSEEVRDSIYKAADDMKAGGAVVEEFELPLIEYAIPAYYIIACAEASSNLSRYDGVKYGFRSENAKNILESYYISRSEGFGTEVKRRIMLGSFVLSSGYFDAYYKKALQVRGLIKGEFDKALANYDFILSPVSPTVAYDIGGQISDPLAMYLADIYTVSVNLTGVPSIALPCGFSAEKLPIGMQFIGKAFSEKTLLESACAYQEITDYHKAKARSI